MPQTKGQARARLYVEAELAERRWGSAALAEHAGIDEGTAGDFLNGSRWPRRGTIGKIEAALGWANGTLARLAEGQEPVVRPSTDSGVLADLPPEALEGLGPVDREEVRAAALATALERAREIRRRLSE